MNLEIIEAPPVRGQEQHTPILFIHGAYHAAWCWEHYQHFFSEQGYRSFAVSLRGHGRSEGRECINRTHLRDYIADAERTVEYVYARTGQLPILVGHSLGGVLVQALLAERVFPAAILLATPTPRALISGIGTLLSKRTIPTLKMIVTGNPSYLYNMPDILSFLFFNPDTPQSIQDKYIPKIRAEQEPKQIIQEVMRMRVAPKMGQTPVLVVGGENDVSFRRHHFQRLAEYYNGTCIFLPGMPHDMMLVENWEESVKAIFRWLRELPPLQLPKAP